MSVQHNKLIVDTMKRGTVPEAKTVLPGMLVDTRNPDMMRKVLPLVTNVRTPGSGAPPPTRKDGPAPRTMPRSFGQIPYAGKMY